MFIDISITMIYLKIIKEMAQKQEVISIQLTLIPDNGGD